MKVDISYAEAIALQKAIIERAGGIDHMRFYADLHLEILASIYRKLDVVIKDKSRTKD